MQRKKNGFGKAILALIFLVAAGFFIFKAVTGYLQSPANSSGAKVAFVVNSGETVSDVAANLEEKGIIRSAFFFKLSAKNANLNGVNAGDFVISPAMTNGEIIEIFKGGSADTKVTLIEGWRVEEMAKKLNQELGIKNEEFIEKAKQYEGYLFPDTYFFHPDATTDTIIQTLRSNFSRKYSEDLQNRIKVHGLSADEGVILASIVEREGRSKEVRTNVASILLKRSKMGMKLDADATVQYAKDTQKLKNGTLDKFWQPILISDYQNVISPYNTYLNNGLPPAPIANPSLMSLQAVADADPNTPYLYYFHNLAGESYYAETLEEHNENVANHK